MGNSPWKKRILQGITISLGPAILWVVWWPDRSCSVRRSQVFDIVPQWILWKKSRYDWYPGPPEWVYAAHRASHQTLLVLRRLLQVQRAAVIGTFSNCWIRVLQYGLQIGAAYSSLGHTKVLYATSLVLGVLKNCHCLLVCNLLIYNQFP